MVESDGLKNTRPTLTIVSEIFLRDAKVIEAVRKKVNNTIRRQVYIPNRHLRYNAVSYIIMFDTSLAYKYNYIIIL